MTKENSIEENISEQFNRCATLESGGHEEWKFYIDQMEILPSSLKIEIDYDLKLVGWDFRKLNFEFIIKNKYTIRFAACSFKSLKIDSYSDFVLNDFTLDKNTFDCNAEINIETLHQSFSENKFHGNKCIIKSNLVIQLGGDEFGNPKNKNNDFELNILNNLEFGGHAKFYAKKLLLETNSVNLKCNNFIFNVNELVVDGVVNGKKDSEISGLYINGIQNEILLKNVKNVKNFSWTNIDKNPKKLSFESVGSIFIDRLKNIDLSGSADLIKGKFEDCNFKNISGEIDAEIYGENKFINCKNITSIKLDDTIVNPNNPYNIIIENSIINKLHFSQSHKLYVKDGTLIDIILNQCNSLKIEDSKIEKITLENCQFNDAIILNDVSFSQSPHISNIKFSSHNVEMRNLKFDDNLSPQASGSYRALMKVCQDAGYENGVIFFHAKELETRHNYLKNNVKNLIKKFKIFSIFDDFIEAFLLFFYNYFSKYGASLFRPLFWIISFFVISISCCVLINNGEFNLFFSLIDLSKLSFKNSLGPLIFALPKGFIEEDFVTTLPSSIKILCFLQTVICSSIWFVWFFMVRRRFKI